MKKLLTAVVCIFVLCLCVGALAEDESFTIENGVLKKYNGSEVSVVIPEGVTEIGAYAFQDSNLQEVSFPSTLTTIGNFAFAQCNSLASFTLPKGVTSLGIGILVDCTSLSSIEVEAGNNTYMSLNGVVITSDGRDLVMYPVGNTAKSYVIPNGVNALPYAFDGSSVESLQFTSSVDHINSDAFSGMSKLQSIVIPDGVKWIGECSFAVCESLKEVSLPDSLETIHWRAFGDCSSLQRIKIPYGVEDIREGAFDDCDNITIEGYDGSVAETFCRTYNIPFISLGSYESTPSEEDTSEPAASPEPTVTPEPVVSSEPIIAPESTATPEPAGDSDPTASSEPTAGPESTATPVPATDEPTSATVGALKYTISGSTATVTGPESKTAKTLTIPATIKVDGKSYKVTAIKAKAFKGMKKLTKVTIGKNVKTIGKAAFQNCSKLKNVVIKTKLLTAKEVGSSAFKGIAKKVTVKVPASKLSDYKKWLVKKGVPKTGTIKK